MGHFQDVEAAWALSEAALDFTSRQSGEVTPEEIFDKVFAASPLVDQARTRAEGGQPLARVFLTSAYGLQWRPQHRDWVPFRHAEIDLRDL